MANVSKISLDGSTYNIRDLSVGNNALCQSSKSVATKLAATDNGSFSLIKNAIVSVKFKNGNTATNTTLNVDSTGAISISTEFEVDAGDIVRFKYNGTSFTILEIIKTKSFYSGNSNSMKSGNLYFVHG